MSSTGVRSKYSVGLNGKGFMLRGTPASPLYVKSDARAISGPVTGSDNAYSKLDGSGWSYWSQTDWSNGFQRLKFVDDATFKDGQGIDVISEYGKVTSHFAFTSALSISGSHTYGASSNHNSDLLLGSVKHGAAKLFKVTSANVLSTVSAMAGISAVNDMSRFGDVTLVAMRRVSGSSLKTLSKYNGSTLSGFRTTYSNVRAVRGIGIRAYISEFKDSLSGDLVSFATNLSAFTSAYYAGKGRKVSKICDLNGTPYLYVEEGRVVQMYRYDELQDKAFPIYKFADLTSWGVTNYASLIIVSGTSNGRRVAYAFNGARLWQIFDDQLLDSSYDFSKPFEYDNQLHTKGAFWDGVAWLPGLYGKYATVQYTPFANHANRAYGFAVTGSLLKLAYLDSSKRQISAFVVSSDFGHQIGAVDKLVNAAIVNTEPLASGQMIEILRSTNEGVSYSSIGTMKFATEGALSNKIMYFPSGFITKTWLYKGVVVGNGSTAPTISDIAFEYRPVPDTKRRWSFSVDAGNDVKLLNGQFEQRDGKALMSEIWLEKEAKRTVVFEDVDACSAKITSAFTSAMTSARVENTRLFPPKGRMRALLSGTVEEMTYTSANGGKILGISRGQKGTKARAYAVNQQLDNYYTVIVTDVTEQINNTDDRKTESIARVSILEV